MLLLIYTLLGLLFVNQYFNYLFLFTLLFFATNILIKTKPIIDELKPLKIVREIKISILIPVYNEEGIIQSPFNTPM